MDRSETGRFQNGHKFATGRPLGARHKLDNEFVADMCKDWMKHGTKVITHVRNNDPSTYLRVMASLLPKEHRDVTDRAMTEAELNDRIEELARRLGLALVRTEPTVDAEALLPGPSQSH